MISAFETVALLFVLSAIFGWINAKFLSLPNTIGLLLMALLGSICLVLVHLVLPNVHITEAVQELVGHIDFYDTVMNGMLAFLLFAGALQVDLSHLRQQKWMIAFMASIGVVISTLATGFGFFYLAKMLGQEIPLGWALVFGALISPTDPIAVFSALKKVHLPVAARASIAGESLFNDGMAIVLFLFILGAAKKGSAGPELTGDNVGETAMLESARVGELFAYEAAGAIVLGLVLGFLASRAMRAIENDVVETLITLATAAGTYAAAQKLGVSGPIAVVLAGMIVGSTGFEKASAETSDSSVFDVWRVIDEILNSMLFLLIGLEVLIIRFDPSFAWIIMFTIPLALFGRFISVAIPILLFSMRRTFPPATIPLLTWGGVRGGISVALALSLPENDYKPLILAATYAVVIFSILVQSLTIPAFVRRYVVD